MQDYMKALQCQFNAPPPKAAAIEQEADQIFRSLCSDMEKAERKQLLQLIDLKNELREMAALQSFISGYKLAWGIQRELTEDPPSPSRKRKKITCEKYSRRYTMAKRRANGEGNIRKRADGRWEGRYVAAHTPNGKAIYKNVLGKTQAEVRDKLKKAIEDSKKLDIIKAGQYTVGQWMDVWHENYAMVKVRPSSHQTYRGYIDNHIKPNIGDIPLSKLTALDLQKFYKKLLSNGRVERIESEKQSKGLSAKTVRNINQVISSAMDLAVAQKIILENPTNACALPKVEHKEMQTIPAEQLQAFLTEAKATGVYEMYYIELATGLRRGELLGLKWQDIDWENGIIKVRRQVARVNGQVVEAPLKTKNSYRAVTISRQAIEVLKQQQKKTSDEYVFSSPNGGPITPDSVNNMLKRVLERAGIPRVRFHDLRHTFATIALQNGVDIKTVSGMLGHFSAGFTLDTYAHVTTAAQKEAAQTMGNVLSM